MSRVERINSSVNACSDVFTHFVATWAVPAADLTVAVLAASNMANVLGFSWPVAILTGFALEGVGIASSKAALECHYYNQVRNDKPPVLEWLAWTVAGVQFLVGFALILVNAVLIDRMVLGLLSIGVLSATGTLAHMLRDDVRARQSARSAIDPDQVSENANNYVQLGTKQGSNADLALAPATAKERVKLAYQADRHADKKDVAAALGLGESTVRKAYRELLLEGAIEHNGDGGR